MHRAKEVRAAAIRKDLAADPEPKEMLVGFRPDRTRWLIFARQG